MNPAILIIVPTLNSFPILSRLVFSLQSQTWQNWRVLFVDGNSTDDHRQWLIDCCAHDSRFSWIAQSNDSPGIFGAMSQGFSVAQYEWVLFWGSDDWAASDNVFSELTTAISNFDFLPDLLVCQARYANPVNGDLGRTSRFLPSDCLDNNGFRRSLWFGSTPPHQSTLFGPGAYSRLAYYSSEFRLSADLDYFLTLSSHSGLRVQCLDLDLVHMSVGGISSQQSKRRFLEVLYAYRTAFGWTFWFPFFARYFRRLYGLLFS